MFNQDLFSNILKKINDTYDTMSEFGKNASFDRTYISKYINKKLQNPPSPKILEKIAKASHGITTYRELMQVCGYLDDFTNNKLSTFNSYRSKLENLGLTPSDINNLKEIIVHSNSENDLSNFLKQFSPSKAMSISNICSDMFNDIANLDILSFAQSTINQLQVDELGNLVKEIPILGTVKAGYDYLAQENWIGTIDVDASLVKDGSEYFALKVHGDSMSPVLVENDIVIVKKQDDFETGDIVVAIINGDEATIKKGKKTDNSILLQPLNNNYEPLIFTNDEMKTIPVKIIGIVKQLKRDF